MIGVFIYIEICVIMGLISCFFGKRLYFPILMTTVFISVIFTAFALFQMTLKTLIIAAVMGVFMAVLSLSIYKIGVFILGGLVGTGLAIIMVYFFPFIFEKYSLVIVVILAFVLGSCALKWNGIFIMLSTSLNGSFLLAKVILFFILKLNNIEDFVHSDGVLATMKGMSIYLKGAFLEESFSLILIGTLILACIGFIVQYRFDLNLE